MFTSPFSELKSHRYISLTTFKKNGEKVALPVWLVAEDNAIYVWTSNQSLKARRLRNNPHCEVAPCNASGKKILGPSIEAKATFLEGAEMERCERLIQKRYGWQYSLIKFFSRRFRGDEGSTVIKIIPR